MSPQSRTGARFAFDTPADRVRSFSTLLGVAGIAFGALPFVSPHVFGRLFGSHVGADPSTAAAYRSVGARDIVLGVGLWSAAYHGGHYGPWVLARLLVDAAASAGGLLAIAQGARRPGFLALVGLSLGTAAASYRVWQEARRVDSQPSGAALLEQPPA